LNPSSFSCKAVGKKETPPTFLRISTSIVNCARERGWGGEKGKNKPKKNYPDPTYGLE
jgi:hypothetical protein